MGNFISQYNPFSVYGSYNLHEKAYENKKTVLIVLSFILIIVITAIVMIWTTESGTIVPQKYDFPPPRYGNGPYGYGLYLPPANVINASLQ